MHKDYILRIGGGYHQVDLYGNNQISTNPAYADGFKSLTLANEAMQVINPSARVMVRITEVREVDIEEIRENALNKLTDAEKKVLGL